jgi:hypothetical protein
VIGGVVREALRGLVNDHCYPSRFPQEAIASPGTTTAVLNEPTWPAIRYTLVNAQNDATHCGTDGRDTDNTTVQIDVVAKTYGAMSTLVDEVINALMVVEPPCLRDGYIEVWDAETKTHRGILTYTFFASTGGGSPS